MSPETPIARQMPTTNYPLSTDLSQEQAALLQPGVPTGAQRIRCEAQQTSNGWFVEFQERDNYETAVFTENTTARAWITKRFERVL